MEDLQLKRARVGGWVGEEVGGWAGAGIITSCQHSYENVTDSIELNRVWFLLSVAGKDGRETRVQCPIMSSMAAPAQAHPYP